MTDQNQTLRTSDSIGEIAKALVAAQAEIGAAVRSQTGQVQNRQYQYSDIAAILAVAKGPLAKHGLCILQGCHRNGNGLEVSTRILHESGEWIETTLANPVADLHPQQLGKVHTYLRRYTLQGILAIPSEDDDCESVPQTAPNRPVPATTGNGPRHLLCEFGKHRGQPVATLPDHELDNYVDYMFRRIDEPDRAKYRNQNIEHARQVWRGLEGAAATDPRFEAIVEKYGEIALAFDPEAS